VAICRSDADEDPPAQLQRPELQEPWQQSLVLTQAPPTGEQRGPPLEQVPF